MTTPPPITAAQEREALLADICSERVILACSAAKAIPGDVWGAGAEGHYAFLCGLAALLRIPEAENSLARKIATARLWLGDGNPMVCPERILTELGFLADHLKGSE